MIFFLFYSSGKMEISEQICSNGIDVEARFQSSFPNNHTGCGGNRQVPSEKGPPHGRTLGAKYGTEPCPG